MAEFESEYDIGDVVFYKQPGELPQQLQVSAITFDGVHESVHCRRPDGAVITFYEDDLVSQQTMEAIRKGRLGRAEEEAKGIGFDDDL